MKPRAFLKKYRFGRPMIDGSYYSSLPLTVEAGDRIGVVLFNLGGPRHPGEVEPFLYNLFMDPAIIDIPLPAFLRDPLCAWIARKRSVTVREEYALIGGASPLNEHSERQARLLEERLAEAVAHVPGVRMSVHLAMRYGWPTSEDAASSLVSAGVNKVVLLPLYPQYSKTTTGASLVYWKALEEEGTLPVLETTSVFEYSTHPALVDAFSGRIDEALGRFPAEVRSQVHLLFSAHGTPLYEMTRRKDPYCCLVHSTVQAIMEKRGHDHPYRVAFQSKVGPAEWLTPSTPDALLELAENGVRHVLIIPVAFVSDHVETAFELDIEVRREAEHAGIELFEVMAGLNDHPRFIDALSEVTLVQLGFSGSETPVRTARAVTRKLACHQCRRNAEARCWTEAEVREPG